MGWREYGWRNLAGMIPGLARMMGGGGGRGWGGTLADADKDKRKDKRERFNDESDVALPDRGRHIKFGGDDE